MQKHNNNLLFAKTGGKSMLPLIKEGDLLILKETRHFYPFDVIAFYDETLKSVIVHRLIVENRKIFLAQGDNVPSFFKVTSSFDIVLKDKAFAKVTGIIRNKRVIKGLAFNIYSYFSLFLALLKLQPYLLKKLFTEPKKLFHYLLNL